MSLSRDSSSGLCSRTMLKYYRGEIDDENNRMSLVLDFEANSCK